PRRTGGRSAPGAPRAPPLRGPYPGVRRLLSTHARRRGRGGYRRRSRHAPLGHRRPAGGRGGSRRPCDQPAGRALHPRSESGELERSAAPGRAPRATRKTRDLTGNAAERGAVARLVLSGAVTMHVGVRWAIVGVGLAVALAPQPLSAQDTTVVDSLPRRKAGHFHLGLTVHDYGVSFGNAARVSGIRLNVQDAEL